jgi:hypothetical protein
MAVPEIGIWLTTFEVSAYLDIAVGLVAAVSGFRWQTARGRIVAIVARIVGTRDRPRDRRTRPIRPEGPAANDDDHRPVMARAA